MKLDQKINDLKIYLIRNPLRLFLAMLAANITLAVAPFNLTDRLLFTAVLFLIIEGTIREKILFIIPIILLPVAVVLQIFNYTNTAHTLTVFSVQSVFAILIVSFCRSMIRWLMKRRGYEP